MIVWVVAGIAGWLAIALALLALLMAASRADRALERQREERLRREQGWRIK